MFHGFDFDNTMLSIRSMDMLHGLQNPDIRYRDSLIVNRITGVMDFTDLSPKAPTGSSPLSRWTSSCHLRMSMPTPSHE